MTITPYDRRLIMMVIILALFASFFLVESYRATKELIEKEKKEEELRIQKETFINNLKTLDLKAKAVSVYDITSKERVFKLNDEIVLPLASLAKSMTAMVVLDNQDKEHLIKISKSDLREEGEYGLKEGDEWKLAELLKFTLVYSSNDGAFASSRGIPNFLNKMNEKAQAIGLHNTHFNNTTGLDEDKEKSISGAYGTAFEANKMAVYALENYNDIFTFTTIPILKVKSKLYSYEVINTNLSIDNIPNILFSKTGFTELAGGNLTVIFRNENNHLMAVTVLSSTQNDRFSDVEKIVNVMYNYPYEI